MTALLEIKDLCVKIEEKEILKNFSLTINEGEIHAIMGPNGSGKSTLSYVIAGHPAYEVTGGSILYKGKDLLEMDPDERANSGIFLAFQHPTELPGVGTALFLKTALNAKRTFLGESDISSPDFIKRLRLRSQALDITDEMLKRSVNVGFSGGEKKKMEIFQMAFLEPALCILDEMDSGLDIDALRTLSKAVNIMKDEKRSFLLITHYQRLLNYITPDFVHIMIDGKIVKSGNKDLALCLEESGYEDYK
ncbi:MAG: Fe-S cluster assembly ATPase SufC [Lactobacillales bacterium]|jgi:Fe-S cluster assembly ATP-binding protein|nr:Fe-S cluster assembly ATPase SufC [Lactobacillales bacterium]